MQTLDAFPHSETGKTPHAGSHRQYVTNFFTTPGAKVQALSPTFQASLWPSGITLQANVWPP